MKHQSSDTKVNLEVILVLKILLGYVFVMSEYVSRRMNVYIGFSIIVLAYIVLWNSDMVRRWDSYSTFEVFNSILTNIPLVIGAVLSILSYKLKELFKYRFLINSCFLMYCFMNGLYFGLIDISYGWGYTSSNIMVLGLLTDLFTCLGGMFLFLALLDDKDAGNL